VSAASVPDSALASSEMPKLRVIVATRVPENEFATATALGRSLALFPYPFVELRLFAANRLGLPALYNRALREAASHPAILIFVHDDVAFHDFFWPNHLIEALRRFDVVGLAGNMRRVPGQPAWRFLNDRWERDDRSNLSGIVAHGRSWPPDYVSYYGPPYRRVQLLDGLLLAAPSHKLLSSGIAFDERFDFHLYDLDFCRQAEVRGLSLGTCSVSVLHGSDGHFGTPEWRAAYQRYLEKWGS
jgi:GT2 family glycosyltransferase